LSTDTRPRSWWAPTTTRARWAAVGAIALVIALAVTTALVWISPQTSPITGASRASAAVTRLIDAQSRADRLQRQVDALQDQIDGKNRKLVTQSSALGHANSQLTIAQQQLQALQSSAAAKAAAAKAVTTGKGRTSTLAPPAAPVTAPSKDALLHPDAPYFGMYTQQAPFNWATYDATTAEIGAQTNLVGYFQGWDQPFRADAVTRSWQHGQMPMMTWESRPISDANDVVDVPDYSLSKIIDGGFDAYLHQYAHDVAATGLPVAIRLDQEMNAIWYPWSETDGSGNSINGNSAGQFVQMWRHVHDVFQAEGANAYVIWDWSPNRIDNLPATHQGQAYTASLYPGDDYVDWVGMSAYLRPPYAAGQKFTFDETFGRTLTQLRAITTKPIILSEIGASETEGHKAAWMNSFFQGLNDPANADIIGFSWFDLAVTSYVQGVRQTNDWRIDSRPDSLAAFVAGLTAPGGRFRLEPAS
jgi:mannan endo-1,4-beta-mannosidase